MSKAKTSKERVNSKSKCSYENIDALADIIKQQMPDDNGRGEFDEESNLFFAFKTVMDWIQEEEEEEES